MENHIDGKTAISAMEKVNRLFYAKIYDNRLENMKKILSQKMTAIVV